MGLDVELRQEPECGTVGNGLRAVPGATRFSASRNGTESVPYRRLPISHAKPIMCHATAAHNTPHAPFWRPISPACRRFVA